MNGRGHGSPWYGARGAGSGCGGYVDSWEWMGPRHWQHNYMAGNAMHRRGYGEGE